MTKDKWFLNGGRGSGKTFRLLCETYENKIAELKRSCDETQELLDKQIEATYRLDKENAEQKKQIEKMKCCANCKHYFCMCENVDDEKQYCDKWELAE